MSAPRAAAPPAGRPARSPSLRLRTLVALVANALSLAFDLADVFWIVGLAAVGYGLAQIYAPGAWIVCGAAVFWMGVRR